MFGRSKMGMESLSEVGCAARGMAGSPVSEGSKRPRGCIRGMNCRMVGNLSVVFFFSSRRRHTRWNCDWGSDVCSSDLVEVERDLDLRHAPRRGWNAVQVEATQRAVVARHLALALQDVDLDRGLAVRCGREDLRAKIGRASCRERV